MDKEKDFNEKAESELQRREQEGNAFTPVETPQEMRKIDLGAEQKAKIEAAAELKASLGEKEFFVEQLPSSGLFYPSDIKLFLRPAKGEEIKHYSTMDEADLIDAEDKLNDIIVSCVKIKSASMPSISYKDILEEDRIKLILAIKDLTFKKGENRIRFEVPCEKCSTSNEVVLSNDILSTHDVSEKLMQYYSEEERLFIVKTKSFGEIRMRPPSIGIMQRIYAYVREKQEKKQTWNKAFVQVLPYIQLDWRGFDDKSMYNTEVDFAGWSAKQYNVVYKMADEMKVGIKSDIEIACSKCGAEVAAPVRFPDGLKSLFIADIDDELL